ncbi:MAG: ABC transporter permease [Candidatus Hodarchaeales archaeon]
MFLSIILDTNKLIADLSFLLNDSRVFEAFSFSLFQAIISTLLTLIIGFPIAYTFSHYTFKGDKTLKALLTIPFLLPPIVVVWGFITVYGENVYSVEGIIFAHVFYNTPIVIRIITVAWESLDRRPLEVAETLGATKIKRFVKMELPQLKYAIISASLLIFLYCFTSFAIVLSFGGLEVRTLEVQVYRFATSLPYLDFALASSLAFIQLVFLLFFIGLYFIITRKDIKQEKLGFFAKSNLNFKKKQDLFFLLFFAVYSLFMVLPMVGVAFYSFTDRFGFYTINNFQILLTNSFDSTIQTTFVRLIINTLFIAFMTVFFSIIISLGFILLVRYWRPIEHWNKKENSQSWFQLILLLPLASSGLLIALGLFSLLSTTPFYTDFNIVVIIMAHSIAALPITSRILFTGFNKLNRDLGQVGASLGANKLEILFKIEIPLIIKALFVASLFSFAISLGEFGSTLFINPQEFTTLGIAIYRSLGAQNLGLTSAMATVLMVLCLISFFLIDKLGEDESIF